MIIPELKTKLLTLNVIYPSIEFEDKAVNDILQVLEHSEFRRRYENIPICIRFEKATLAIKKEKTILSFRGAMLKALKHKAFITTFIFEQLTDWPHFTLELQIEVRNTWINHMRKHLHQSNTV